MENQQLALKLMSYLIWSYWSVLCAMIDASSCSVARHCMPAPRAQEKLHPPQRHLTIQYFSFMHDFWHSHANTQQSLSSFWCLCRVHDDTSPGSLVKCFKFGNYACAVYCRSRRCFSQALLTLLLQRLWSCIISWLRLSKLHDEVPLRLRHRLY